MKNSEARVCDFEIQDIPHAQLWRRQCARNLMDCYALGMDALSEGWESGDRANAPFEGLARLMVDGMTAVQDAEDEKSFYRTAAGLCRGCAEACGDGRKAGLFRIYAVMFADMAGEEA